MTVTYSADLTSAQGTTLIRLLFTRWKGSLLRLVWRDLFVFLSIFYALQVLYYFVCNAEYQKYFEALVEIATKDADRIPVSFLLGFFVSNGESCVVFISSDTDILFFIPTSVMARWWSQFEAIPSPSKIAVLVTTTIHGNDEVGRVMRRTIMRYVNLSLVMVFRVLSPKVKTRYPRMDDLIEAGFITESELAVMKSLDEKYPCEWLR
jgi:hypothetical protein